MVDEAKWLEITRQTNPRNVHCPQGKIKVSEKKGVQINERIGRDGDENNLCNSTVEKAVKELETRLSEMKELLEKKTRTIERQEEIIAKLNGRLANLTSESRTKKSYLNDSAQSSCCETRSDEKDTPDMQQSVGDAMTEGHGSSLGRVLRKGKGSQKEQLRKTCNRSNNHNIDEQCGDVGKNPGRASPANQVRVRQSFLERLDSLEAKMDNLEAELPKKIRAICAELFQRGLPECRHKFDDCGTTSPTNPSPSAQPNTVREVPHAEVGVDATQNMESFSSQHQKFDPLASIPGLLSEKYVHHSNPQDPLKWNKSPAIKPKTNLSANYRLSHTMSAPKSGEKWLKSSHHKNLIHPYPLQMVEEKLSSIEQVVHKFKQYLLTILFHKLQS